MNKNNIENNININYSCPPSPTNNYELYNPEEYINIIENTFEYDLKNKKLIIKTMDKTNTNEDKDFNKKINNLEGLIIEEIGKKVLEKSQKKNRRIKQRFINRKKEMWEKKKKRRRK